jgi:hypothetical protein
MISLPPDLKFPAVIATEVKISLSTAVQQGLNSCCLACPNPAAFYKLTNTKPVINSFSITLNSAL